MKAITYQKYGGPEVVEYLDVERPSPGENEILVKVAAASLNPYDWHYMRGKPYFMRAMTGILRPKKKILGNDFAGWVEEIGKNVTSFKVGDEVYGGSGLGAFAEYVTVKVDRVMAKPTNATMEEAAALPIAGETALQCLQEYGQLKSGQTVLINGASGGVGTFAVQIAKHFEAEVTGVCSTANLDLVKSIGADQVLDYTEGKIVNQGLKFDLIIDAIGNLSVKEYEKLLNPGGRSVIAGFTSMGQMLKHVTLGKWSKYEIGLMTATTNQATLNQLKELVESHKIKPIIDRKYTLEKTPQAIEYLETMRAKGKVVINISSHKK